MRARLAAGADGDARVAEHERPDRRAPDRCSLVGSDDLQRLRIDVEARLQRTLGERLRGVARQMRACGRLRQRMRHRAHGAVVGDGDAPLLRARRRRRRRTSHSAPPRTAARASCRRDFGHTSGPASRQTNLCDVHCSGHLRSASLTVATRCHCGPSVAPCAATAASAMAMALSRARCSGCTSAPNGAHATTRRHRPIRAPATRAGMLRKGGPRRALYRRRVGPLRTGAPRAVAQCRRQFAPCAGLPAAPSDDHQRHGRGDDHQHLLQLRAGRIDEEQRNREQRQIERRVQQDRRHQAEAQEDRAPRRSTAARARRVASTRESRDSSRAPAEHQRLHDDRDGDAERPRRKRAPISAPRDSGIARNTHSSMNPACSDIAIGVSAGTARAEDVRIGQHLRRLPPAEPAVRRVVERCDECQARSARTDSRRACDRRFAASGRRRATRRATAADGAETRARVRLSAAMNTSAYASPPATAINSATPPCFATRMSSPVSVVPAPNHAGARRGQRVAASSVPDDEPRADRRAPDEPVRAREPQHGEDAAADAVEHARRRRSRDSRSGCWRCAARRSAGRTTRECGRTARCRSARRPTRRA